MQAFVLPNRASLADVFKVSPPVFNKLLKTSFVFSFQRFTEDFILASVLGPFGERVRYSGISFALF